MSGYHRILAPVSRDVANRAMLSARSLSDVSRQGLGRPTTFNFTALNEILYRGRDDRQQRYTVYEAMDKDADVARALDIIAEHCTTKDPRTGNRVVLRFKDEVTQEENETLATMFDRWISLNGFDNRICALFRNLVMFGDAFFIRDPKTYRLMSVDAKNVMGIYIHPENYEIGSYYFQNLILNVHGMGIASDNAGYAAGATAGSGMQSRQTAIIDAEHVIHISLSEGQEYGGNGRNGDIWPFGESFLEQVYKSYRQRSLLEDSFLVHQVQRAPARRVWYIDVGKLRADRADAFTEQFKNALQQKVVPSKYGGKDTTDINYNPISMLEDFYIQVGSDGRGSKVEMLEGQQWDSTENLKYFSNKLHDGLRVPTSYLMGAQQGGSSTNDGKLGIAFLQEQQFSRFCERIQELVDNHFDMEFKLFLEHRGVHVSADRFEVKFVAPMNFDAYRDIGLQESRLNIFTQLSGMKHFAKRFAMKRYLGMDEDEVMENERMWAEENRFGNRSQYASENSTPSAPSGFGAGADFGLPPDMGMGPESGGDGMEMGGSDDTNLDPSTPAAPAATSGSSSTSPMPSPSGGVSLPLGGPAGVESYHRPSGGQMLMEEDGETIPLEKRPFEPEVPNPDGSVASEESDRRPRMTLRHIRKMRIEREKNRLRTRERMELLGRQYGAPEDSGPGF